MSPARRAAHDALLHVERGARLEDVLRGRPLLRELRGPDARLAHELVNGCVKRRATLDAVLARVSRPSLRRTDPRVLAALRLGAYQLLFLDRVPSHAAVDESVRLVGGSGPRTRGYVNAVLRGVAVRGPQLLSDLGGDDDASVAARLSYPLWLVQALRAEWGAERGIALLEAGNAAAERCLRVDPRCGTIAEVASALACDGVEITAPSAPWPSYVPWALLYDGEPLESTAAYHEGWVTAQSRAAQLVVEVAAGVAPQPRRVADLCAAPGLKTAQLAASFPEGNILACESEAHRCHELRGTLKRLHATNVRVVCRDARSLPVSLDGDVDLAVVDAPCTGLGTLSGRPDLRWRKRPRDAARLSGLQSGLVHRAARLLRAGGVLVYAVCTLTRVETLDVVEGSLQEDGLESISLGERYPDVAHPDSPQYLQTLPDRDGTSGFFIAALRKPDRMEK